MDHDRVDYADPVSRPSRRLVFAVVVLVWIAEAGCVLLGIPYVLRLLRGGG